MSLSPLSGVVLGAAAIVASPALWMATVEGTLPIGDAMTRYLISVAVCWIAISVVASLAFPDPGTAPTTAEKSVDDAATAPAEGTLDPA